MIEITGQPIDMMKIVRAASSDAAGAINTFTGTVRNETKGKRVVRLEYEAYEPMAIREIKKIADEACAKWKICQVAVSHRTGTLYPGDMAVVIAVSAPHRQEGFDACEFIIDRLKQTVPIWKREIFEDGEEWVSAHP
jgi:molybdopterin synthase catalytic subunit